MIEQYKTTPGGHLALDFVNTLSWDPSDASAGERLLTYQHVLDWALEAGLISRKTFGALGARAQSRPKEAEDALRDAIAVRGAMHEIFAAYAGNSGTPRPESVDLFNSMVARVPLRLSVSTRGGEWDWPAADDDLTSVLWPVIWAAAILLTAPDLAKVKQCEGDRCGWVFLDQSRRHNRKWCDMRDCGNRAKARRHYYRHRG